MSSSSLYGSTGNVTVSANNLTTLYNATTGNVVTQSVPDKDFTTLYTTQTSINPTRQYGNSNVEAFLNQGTDGANTVQNIIMTGNLNVGGTSDLGPVGNVIIEGGASGYILATDGTGNLTWVDPTTGQSINPYIHFDVAFTANNQSFVNSNLAVYDNADELSLFKNGVNIEPFYYEKTADDTVQVNIWLRAGDTVDILPSGIGGGSSTPGGSPFTVQYNGGVAFEGSNSFTFSPTTNTLSVTNLEVLGLTDLGDASNITIDGGSANYVLTTDGSGSVSWQAQAGANSSPAGNIYEVQFNSGANSFASDVNLFYSSNTLNATKFSGNGALLTSLTGANVTGVVANATYSVTANYSAFSNVANVSNVSYSVSGANVVGSVSTALAANIVTDAAQPAITSTGTLTGLTSTGVIDLTATSNVSLGSVGNVKITGGSANYFLKTDGAGNLSWDVVSGGSGTPGGSNTYVQFNDGGAFAGVSSFNFDKIANVLHVPIVHSAELSEIVNATEVVVFPGSTVTGSYTYDTSQSSVVQCTTNTTGNFTINFVNLSLTTGRARSFAFINKNASGTTYRVTGISIGGSAQTVNWLGGSAPTTGSVNDIYNITIIQTGVSTYSVFASVGSF